MMKKNSSVVLMTWRSPSHKVPHCTQLGLWLWEGGTVHGRIKAAIKSPIVVSFDEMSLTLGEEQILKR